MKYQYQLVFRIINTNEKSVYGNYKIRFVRDSNM
jgi:hypothetical protein